MNVLGLKDAIDEFEKTNSGKRKEVYHCEFTNNTLVFYPADAECDTTSICNCIPEPEYQRLIDYLNEEENLVVYWSQVEGTTSDYTIYKDMHLSEDELRSFRKITKRLEAAVKEDVRGGLYKYNIVENGVVTKLSFEEGKR